MALCLFYRSTSGQVVPVDMAPDATVGELRAAIQVDGHSGPSVKLMFGGVELQPDSASLADLSVCPESQIEVLPATGGRRIACGLCHTMAIRNDGRLQLYGEGSYLQGTLPTDLPSSLCVAVSAGTSNSLALFSDGQVRCWGWNSSDQTQVPDFGGRRAVAAAMGYNQAVAALDDGTTIEWGKPTVRLPRPDARVVDVALGNGVGAWLLEDNRAVVFNSRGAEMVDRAVSLCDSTVAVGVVLDDGTVSVWQRSGDCRTYRAAADASGEGVTIRTAAVCEDSVVHGLTGDGCVVPLSQGDSCSLPRQHVRHIAGGGRHWVAVLSDDSIVGFGANDRGQHPPKDAKLS